MANKKLTYVEALNIAIQNLTVSQEIFPNEVLEKLVALRDSLQKKSASPKKLTAQQKKNEALKEEIVEFLADTPDVGYTVTDLLKNIPVLEGDSNQHVSAILRQLVDKNKDGRVEKYTEKRRTYFRIA